MAANGRRPAIHPPKVTPRRYDRLDPVFRALACAYPVGYTVCVIEIRRTDDYARWFYKLRDRQARFRILARVRRLSLGNPRDVVPVEDAVPRH